MGRVQIWFRNLLNNIPYASVISFLLVMLGAGLMSGTLCDSLRIVRNDIFMNRFNIDVSWIFWIQLGGVCFAVLSFLLAIFLLAFGAVSTGKTRRRLFHSEPSLVCGLYSAKCFICSTFVFTLMAAAGIVLSTLPLVLWGMIRVICSHELYQKPYWRLFNYTLNLTSYGLYFPVQDESYRSIKKQEEFGDLCKRTNDAGPLFSTTTIGFFILFLGLSNFLTIVSSIHQRLIFSRELGEYRELLDTNAEEPDQNEDEVAALTDAAAAGVGFTTHEMGAVPGGGGGLPPFLDYPHTAVPAAAPTGFPVGYYPGQTSA